jgi:exosome complex component RRP42
MSPPLAYPLPLLSLTTHLALLSTRLPRLRSEGDEDPMFDDDWQVARPLYAQGPIRGKARAKGQGQGQDGAENDDEARPAVTLLVAAVGDNILLDPSREELAVADTALAVSVVEAPASEAASKDNDTGDVDMDKPAPEEEQGRVLLCAMRTISAPARRTAPGVPMGTTASMLAGGDGFAPTSAPPPPPPVVDDAVRIEGLWRAPVGGTSVEMIERMLDAVLRPGGGGEEVLDGLKAVDVW